MTIAFVLSILTSLWYILEVVLAIGFIIFVHELGHFLVAKWSGVRCPTFSFGFGKRLFGYLPRKPWRPDDENAKKAVEEALSSVDGVTTVEVDLGAGSARVDGGSLDALIAAVAEEGYTATPA